MSRALATVRAMHIAGRHLQNCFFDPAKKKEGSRQVQMARRICRRLGWKPEAIL